MSLEDLNLDDLLFQKDFVDQARLNIIQHAPEWTDYNVSDPGITLIELFAWMAEQLTYRLNQVPDEHLIKFLQLLGVEPKPIRSAIAELTFYLSIPFPINANDEDQVLVPLGTEVTTRPTELSKPLSFTTDEGLIIRAVKLIHLRRGNDKKQDYLGSLKSTDGFVAFQELPQEGDVFYLGFDSQWDMSGYVLRLDFKTKKTKQSNIDPKDPPLVWECLVCKDEDKDKDEDKWEWEWEEVPVSREKGEEDSTEGLLRDGSLVLYLPRSLKAGKVHDEYKAFWLRCSYQPRKPSQGEYAQSPRLKKIEVFTLGATTTASNTMIVEDERLGISDGKPGQFFELEHAPLPKLKQKRYIIEEPAFKEIEEEILEVKVQENVNGQLSFFVWSKVQSFANSDRHDRHFMLEPVKGEIRFGPAIRQPNGELKQYGRVPEPGAEIRVSDYRYGGGYRGNVRARQIELLRTPIEYIDRVTNLKPATGGQDQENLQQAIITAQQNIHRQKRAVTAKDYEKLVLDSCHEIKRVKCYTNQEKEKSGVIELLLVPDVAEAVEKGDLSKLQLSTELKRKVKQKLDQYLLLTTTLLVRTPRYLGVQVVAEIVSEDWAREDELKDKLILSLNRFLTPLSSAKDKKEVAKEIRGENASALLSQEEKRHQDGWPFGYDLDLKDIYSRLQKIAGVRYVQRIELRARDVELAELKSKKSGQEVNNEDFIVRRENDRSLPVTPDTLICSLPHEIKFVKL